MKRPEFIARQSGHPKGLIGNLIAMIMAEETAPENEFALDLLDLEPDDTFLDIGTGHGATLRKAAERLPNGFAMGIDPSKVMVRHARCKVRPFAQHRRVAVDIGDARSLAIPDATFQKVLTVHTVYFWDELATPLSEIFRVTKPGGRFVICFRPAEDISFEQSFPKSVYRIRLKKVVLDAIGDAGFTLARVLEHVEPEGRLAPLVFAVADKPGAAN